ncbi:hypothetical protein F5Y06DRAFT_271116 [Hypoxylon sp. FL0890]|nr:hypothetical protein F5Y06DRAFT_271116 [Hypoxylon sp. FL0890]
MQALIITASLARRSFAPGLEINLPVIAAQPTHQEIELPAPGAALPRDNSVTLERPGVGGRHVRERQRLVRRRVVADVQVLGRVGALQPPADVEVLARGLGAHDGDLRILGICLQIVVEDGRLYSTDLLRLCQCRGYCRDDDQEEAGSKRREHLVLLSRDWDKSYRLETSEQKVKLKL